MLGQLAIACGRMPACMGEAALEPCAEYEMAGMGPQARPCIIVKECASIRDGWSGMLGDACPYRERALVFSGPA